MLSGTDAGSTTATTGSTARPNDFLYVPPGGIHGFRNEADEPASILMLFAPGAPREYYFEGLRRAGRPDRRRTPGVVHQATTTSSSTDRHAGMRRCVRRNPLALGCFRSERSLGCGLTERPHPGFAGLAASGAGEVSGRQAARFPGRRDPWLRQDDLCPAHRRRTARRGHRRAVTVVVPTEHLKTQWAQAAARVGIALDPKFSNSNSRRRRRSTTASSSPTPRWPATRPGTGCAPRTASTLVVFDEIHHGGDAKSWGEAIREAFDDATRRLALTGTPFRSDDSAIPFVTYEPDADGLRCARRPTTPTATPTRWPTAWCGR